MGMDVDFGPMAISTDGDMGAYADVGWVYARRDR